MPYIEPDNVRLTILKPRAPLPGGKSINFNWTTTGRFSSLLSNMKPKLGGASLKASEWTRWLRGWTRGSGHYWVQWGEGAMCAHCGIWSFAPQKYIKSVRSTHSAARWVGRMMAVDTLQLSWYDNLNRFTPTAMRRSIQSAYWSKSCQLHRVHQVVLS